MPSIPTEALLDVNVIIAAAFADHVMHQSARRFVKSLERFYTTPTVQGGFLRFATRPMRNDLGELQTPRLTMSEALESWKNLRALVDTLSSRTVRRSLTCQFALCRAIGSGQTPIFFTSQGNTAFVWPRLKAGWQYMMILPHQFYL